MNRKLLASLALVAMLALASCSKNQENTGETTPANTTEESTTSTTTEEGNAPANTTEESTTSTNE